MPSELVELVAARFRLLSEPTRIRLLDALRHGGRSVGELAEVLGASQQNVSGHLAGMHAARVLGRRKEGTRVVYWIADESVLALCEAVCGALERQTAQLAALVGSARG